MWCDGFFTAYDLEVGHHPGGGRGLDVLVADGLQREADELDARDDEHDGRAPGVEEAARRREIRELLEGRAVPGGRRAEPGEQEDLFSFSFLLSTCK